MNTEQKEKAIDFARNYHLVSQDGNYGGITVGNITEYNGRVIINLCLRTAKTNPLNATISYPRDWPIASRFKTSDIVDVIVSNGYVEKIKLTRFMPIGKRLSAAGVNQAIADDQAMVQAGLGVEEVMAQIDSVTQEQSLAELSKATNQLPV